MLEPTLGDAAKREDDGRRLIAAYLQTKSSTRLYSAKLVWDGNAYQLVKIEGRLSCAVRR